MMKMTCMKAIINIFRIAIILEQIYLRQHLRRALLYYFFINQINHFVCTLSENSEHSEKCSSQIPQAQDCVFK